MKVRFLKKGEGEKWFRMLRDDPGKDFTLDDDYRIESHIVVEEDRRLSGGMVLMFWEPDTVILFNPTTENNTALDSLVCKGIDTAKSLNAGTILSLLHGSNNQFNAIRDVLLHLGFFLGLRKELYTLKPAAYSPTEIDISLTYKSALEITEDAFIQVFKSVFEPDFFDSDAANCFAELKMNAVDSGRFYPEDWEIAYDNDKPVGLTMPQLHDADGEIGSNFYLGVLPDERKKGWGTFLQRKAVETLIRRGVDLIAGSTDVKNKPMRRIFRRLGYQLAEHQYFFKYREH
ncbi:MAG: GNAT family N-acetyltransferase [candidate division WOR-3 bacterium]|nr:MAG: GNAT family N-acetyltransferase [candidate division WOR-3 bacterium]